MIEGKYDNVRVAEFDDKTWSELWTEYIYEAKRFSGKQRLKIFGDENIKIEAPLLTNKDKLNGIDKKLIGEFIRRHHPRIAHEISFVGLIGKDNKVISFASNLETKYKDYKDLAGLLARSHGIEVRDTFDYLKKFSEEEWSFPYSIQIVFLMTVIRLADYFQIESSRVSIQALKLKTFSSPVSELEHFKHLSIKFVKQSHIDSEALTVEADPKNSLLYIKLKELFKDIQHELDISWAVLGEVYGRENFEKKPNLKYRRIRSNLERKSKFSSNAHYVSERVVFTSDEELPKLLIAPLYGDDPSFGVRELLQNSIDACREREIEENKTKNNYHALIKVTIDKDEENKPFFEIKDNGRGMTLIELKNYFLKAGASFRKSADWQKKFVTDEGQAIVLRSGKFGVGVLAAFLIGEEINVCTKSIYSSVGYKFKADIDR
jgi:hypothetical protein